MKLMLGNSRKSDWEKNCFIILSIFWRHPFPSVGVAPPLLLPLSSSQAKANYFDGKAFSLIRFQGRSKITHTLSLSLSGSLSHSLSLTLALSLSISITHTLIHSPAPCVTILAQKFIVKET